jgi:hypothetical protein
MIEVALSTSVTGLAPAIAGLCDGLESPSAVDVHQNARGSAHEGVCIAAGVAVAGGACEWRRENRVCRERSVSSARVQSEWGDVWRQDGRPHSRGG